MSNVTPHNRATSLMRICSPLTTTSNTSGTLPPGGMSPFETPILSQLLMRFAVHKAFAQTMVAADVKLSLDIEEGGTVSLNELTRSGNAHAKQQIAVGCQRMRTQDGNHVAIAAEGVIPPLIELMRSGTAAATEQAAGSLANLAVHRDKAVAIQSAGGIHALLEVTREGAPGAKEQAAAALRIMSRQEYNQVAIVAAGGIVSLVELVRNGFPRDLGEWNACLVSARDEAAGALANLSSTHDNKMAIADAGGIGPLVELACSGGSRAQKWAAAALANLADGNRGNKVRIAAAGGIAPLVELTRSGAAQMQAAAALLNLASDNADNAAAIVAAGGVLPLVKPTRSGAAGATEFAAAAQANLTTRNDSIPSTIEVAAGSFPPIETKLNGSEPRSKPSSAVRGKPRAHRVEILKTGPTARRDSWPNRNSGRRSRLLSKLMNQSTVIERFARSNLSRRQQTTSQQLKLAPSPSPAAAVMTRSPSSRRSRPRPAHASSAWYAADLAHTGPASTSGTTPTASVVSTPSTEPRSWRWSPRCRLS